MHSSINFPPQAITYFTSILPFWFFTETDRPDQILNFDFSLLFAGPIMRKDETVRDKIVALKIYYK